MSRCPVDETGRNSVIPSIIPSTTMTNQSGIPVETKRVGKNQAAKGTGRQRHRESGCTPIAAFSRSAITYPLSSLFFFLAEHRAQPALGIIFSLADLELAEHRVPSD